MCWERYEQRELRQEQQRAQDEEALRVQAEVEQQAAEPTSAEEDERELVPA